MCGFTGFIGTSLKKENDLNNMMNTIIHRGPDSEGKYVDEDAALGFRRLSIIDLTHEGDQPIYNENQTLVLVFNGEIYNYKELKEELIKEGHVFKSNTDSETIIHGYEQWQEGLVQRLRGMFAFVIWDKNKKELFGARDMFGIKPFYYANMNETLFFGSEIKSFLPHPLFKKEFNEEQLGNYLSFQFVPSNETFFKGVFCLEPGHYFKYKNKELHIKQYYEPKFECNSQKELDEVITDVEDLLEESVEMHKNSDVEVASYLSGGIDSSYLAYLGNVEHTYTVGFKQQKYSEIDLAKEFAKEHHMKNSAKVIEADEYWNKISDIMYYMDEPVADPAAIALYFLSKEASKDVKCVLSGEGADEVFGGYNIYCEPLENNWYNIVPSPIRKVLGKFAENVLPNGLKGRGFLMRKGKKLEDRYFSNATNVFTSKEASKLLKSQTKVNIKSITAPIYERVKDKDDVTKMQYLDFHLWLVHDILMKGDKMGMANSVEVRVPFLDKKVFRYASSLPLNYKVQPPHTKLALRLAAHKSLQKKNTERKKLGFPVPIRVWLKEDKYYNLVKKQFLSKTAQKFFNTDILIKMLDEHKNGKNKNEKTDHSRRIWTVYVFIIWYNRFFQELPTSRA
ncbi:MAG: asparagine synthase (glutamine-hydrolyzing) [Thomasclavelia sp.]|nr:asparagine synthase (glutamine-hydrolyzing) [Thomasclavelia sp.]